uniref:Histone deacetylase interacting domain-containing protein n=1 Tax=Percolomonas cosmopolitus TaxID=63605 RepID=A0A7S1PIK3_9EUKA|mmetsp:Transcript_814/g.2772  ORF Transcript_814/g.2772 Transcript_814/m.2772 type:complete len:886 (+) Transcript_814:224-2881(+)|eukprot:CAMPEP_0117441682 /NCGR_PEP_ID=MMETSP0759-20121206/3759_1 /TAXON_ID=63605 /ORGANISM="Percolomonas cosmopolitus, Strain WS" /LENGTH=885 /DNA_ID=CAMNT_0005233541 /DNA_START=219 /DNA_END=2876 /DNA_ORIENTATION=+
MSTSTTASSLKRTRDTNDASLLLAPPPKRICIEDAVQYIEQVKQTFLGPKENMYLEFLRLMSLFKEGRLNAVAICDRIKILFKGFEHLIKGFNVFLPTEFHIGSAQLDSAIDAQNKENGILPPDPTETANFSQAMTFLQNIKQRFSTDSKVYNEFLETLHLYKERVLDLNGVYDRARNLLAEHDDLWTQFMLYLPPVQQEKFAKRLKDERQKAARAEAEGATSAGKKRKPRKKKHIWRYGAVYDGPSYEMVPDNAPRVKCSGRGDLEDEVLNDDLICVGARRTRLDRYIRSSENLTNQFRYLKQVEDAMIELETTLGAAKDFVTFLESIQKKIDAKEDVGIAKEDLTQMHRGVLRHVYASKKNKIVKALRSNPTSSVPVVHKRFVQLIESWEAQKKASVKNVRAAHEVALWEAFRRNLAAFKVAESKELTEKFILNDALDRFKYHAPFYTSLSVKNIHKDIFKLVITRTQLPKERVKEVWRQLIVPFFHLEPQQEYGETQKELFEQLQEMPTTGHFPAYLTHRKDDMVFYANTSLMLFFRFYILMFERLLLARKAAQEKRTQDLRRKKDNLHYATSDVPPTQPPTPVSGGANNESVDAATNGGSTAQAGDQEDKMTDIADGSSTPNKQGAADVQKNATTTSTPNATTTPSNNFGQPILYPFQTTEIVDDYYERFMELTQNILAEQIEQQTYEEELMKYLGFESYNLFTFVHVFEHLEAKLYNVINAANSQSLLDAFRYELQRAHPFQDDLYFRSVNRAATFNEDIYEVNHNKDSRRFVLKKIDNIRRHHPFERLTSQGHEYLQQIINPSTQHSEQSLDEKNRSLKVFLRRNKTRAEKFFKVHKSAPTDNVCLLNGMEFYLCIVTMRMKHKEGSSDVFVRVKRGDK